MNKLYKKILDINYLPKYVNILVIVLINWTFQSLLYMDKTEKAFKLTLDLILFVIFFIILKQFMAIYAALLISLIIAHTINWIINGHIYALLKTFGVVKTKPDVFIQYLDNLKEKSSKENSILLVATFGSLSREELNENSDLDVRIVRKKGNINGLKTCIFTLMERSWAFFNKFPLDLYLLDNFEEISKLKEDPVLVYSDSVVRRNNYKNQ